MSNLTFLRVYLSPFKRPGLKFYTGKIEIGTPIFHPRRMVREGDKYIFKSKRMGFDFVDMGWKTKWSETDYRHERNPVWSFVFLKWQIALMFIPEHDSHYWECWLSYLDTKGRTKERIKRAREKFPCVWRVKGKPVCYWDKVLKSKYVEK